MSKKKNVKCNNMSKLLSDKGGFCVSTTHLKKKFG